VSNAIRFDPLLVRHLAHELDGALRGRACAAAPLFTPERAVILPLDGAQALRLDLHPTRGWVRLVPWAAEADELDALCTRVEAPADERRLVLRLRTADRFRLGERDLVLELHTNQWNALLVNRADERILAVLRGRGAGGRGLWPGQPYTPPPGSARYGAEPVERGEALARWMERLGTADPVERERLLVREFAWTGTTNAPAILGAAREPGAVEEVLLEAFVRWWELRTLTRATPVLIQLPGMSLPYPVPLEGTAARTMPSLLDAMAAAAAVQAPPPSPHQERELLLARLEARAAAIERKIESLRSQQVEPEEIDRLRAKGDLLLSNLRLVPKGADHVRLRGWDGKMVDIALDPALSGADNAARWYGEARRRARATERLPALIAEAEADRARWVTAREAAERGPVPEWAARALERTNRLEGTRSQDAEQARPYREYRTSGGLEVRVGRNARDNDRLTFGHSSPNDVWLHARSVAGSHVILRWSNEDAPPARDLEEAATLAALYSRARSSALVAVDWTRRKHVRKPRAAPPGAVIPQRVKTLFVEPDAAFEERLRG
jgi:hypothetical protein